MLNASNSFGSFVTFQWVLRQNNKPLTNKRWQKNSVNFKWRRKPFLFSSFRHQLKYSKHRFRFSTKHSINEMLRKRESERRKKCWTVLNRDGTLFFSMCAQCRVVINSHLADGLLYCSSVHTVKYFNRHKQKTLMHFGDKPENNNITFCLQFFVEHGISMFDIGEKQKNFRSLHNLFFFLLFNWSAYWKVCQMHSVFLFTIATRYYTFCSLKAAGYEQRLEKVDSQPSNKWNELWIFSPVRFDK